ncbi:NACHT domain-containing protein [Anaeromyxobacter terrae]|uniref:hypothetical protein n=1 Tax=Anaeromyxobacter terrae TaxID=2925406 RepID=UPI001F5A61BC|nr:hypothetical protein [Anaeromyxobacter sp. SG22]
MLTAFADRPADVNIDKGKLLAQLHDELVEAALSVREGAVWVEEGGQTLSAERWLTHRVARLPLLADRIVQSLHPEPSFVTPGAQLLDDVETAPGDELRTVDDAAQVALNLLSRRPAGTSSVVYLTSDAGEGKTTLINEMAIAQANAFKRKESDWLLVPVTLGGRPFMRLDDVIVSGLLNRYRFSLLYYDAFLELVRLGVVVPALDGFEEMFVETASGEAMSALGNLIQLLNRSGTVLIAARKAFFEYTNPRAQAKLLDALGSASVLFSRLALLRWDRDKFTRYATKRGVQQPDLIYDDVSARLGPDHPLLTRAVLVKRLLDVAENVGDRDALLRTLEPHAEDFFPQFVDAIINREATEKWITNSGEPREPLLSREEHHQLLAMIAQEMWENRVDALSGPVLDSIAELYAEGREKGPDLARQIVERVRHHALIVQNGDGRSFAFDHEEFRYFFLGEAIGHAVLAGRVADIRASLRVGSLVPMAVEGAAAIVRRDPTAAQRVLATLGQCCEAEGSASFARENAGAIVSRLLPIWTDGECIERITFPPDALNVPEIRRVTFERCYFRPTVLPARMESCVFRDCEFERVTVHDGAAYTGAEFVQSVVRSVCRGDEVAYDPGRIIALLQDSKVRVQQQGVLPAASPAPISADGDLVLARRMLKAFMRATELNEGTLRARAGKAANEFVDRVLPALVRAGAVREVDYVGSGQQRRFRLGMKMTELQALDESSQGSFGAFLDAVRGRVGSAGK